MKMPRHALTSLRDRIADASDGSSRLFFGASISPGDFLGSTSLGGRLLELRGLSVLLAAEDQLAAALALIELDGIARRLIICPPDLPTEHLPSVIARGSVDAIVSDHELHDHGELGVPLRVLCNVAVTRGQSEHFERRTTEWVLLTSGTTGAPKMIVHTLDSLTAPVYSSNHQEPGVVWGTFYDIRRYGGMQIFLRAVLAGGSLVLSGAGESTGDYLLRLGAHGATHVSGTPSHWRRALMSPQARMIAPRYVRLSGEIADQGILDTLQLFYPQARVSHAFASTEAGLAFEVNDGLEGFPASFVGARGEVEMKIENGSLRIRSPRIALRYIGGADGDLAGADGFVDTGDMVEQRGDRYYFLGRRNGVINVGGLKVYPEEVEAVINRHPSVRMSLVWPRKSTITGSLVAADVVLKEEPAPAGANGQIADCKGEILRMCRETLAAHKVPVTIRCVPALEVAGAGKLARHHA